MKTYTAIVLDDIPGGSGEFLTRPANNVLIDIPWPNSHEHIGILSSFGHITVYENYDISIEGIEVHLINAVNTEPIVSLFFNTGLAGVHMTPRHTITGSHTVVQNSVPQRERTYYDAEQTKGLRAHLVIHSSNPDMSARFKMDIRLCFVWIKLDSDGLIPVDKVQIVQIANVHQHSGTSAAGISQNLCLFNDGTLKLLTLNNTTGESTWVPVDLV